MALSKIYVQNYGQFTEMFGALQRGQAPDHFTVEHLKDLGFTSSNHRAFIPLLKALGFLSPDGQPTQRYHEYRNAAQSRVVMGQALRDAYADLFVLRSSPTDADRPVIEGKFKSSHNTSEHVAKLMANTFFSLLQLADIGAQPIEQKPTDIPVVGKPEPRERAAEKLTTTTLHYDIQIHLPATKDIEVFNAIFKSLREHLIE